MSIDCKIFPAINKEEMSDLLKSQKIYKTMLLYCLKFRKNTVSQNANVSKKYKQNLILLSK